MERAAEHERPHVRWRKQGDTWLLSVPGKENGVHLIEWDLPRIGAVPVERYVIEKLIRFGLLRRDQFKVPQPA